MPSQDLYSVYKVEFPEHNAIYIGATNNIRRRKDQHNDNARNRKGRFGKFLSDKNITLTLADMVVVESFRVRADALKKEKDLVIEADNSGSVMLNNNYTRTCTRVGLIGEKNPIAKEFVFIDMKTSEATVTKNLSGMCKRLGLNYKSVVATSKGNPKSYRGRYLVRPLEVWETLTRAEKSEMLNGQWIKRMERELSKRRSRMTAKNYIVMLPCGEHIKVNNLDKFASDNGINPGNLHASFSTGRKAKGHIVIKRL